MAYVVNNSFDETRIGPGNTWLNVAVAVVSTGIVAVGVGIGLPYISGITSRFPEEIPVRMQNDGSMVVVMKVSPDFIAGLPAVAAVA